MHLTQTHRQAFELAVMADVPKEDYVSLMLKTAMTELDKLLPKEVMAFYKKYPDYTCMCRVSLPSGFSSITHPAGTQGMYILQKDKKTWDKLSEISNLYAKQQRAMRDLQERVRSLIDSCRTLKQAEEMLPEFKKHLPQDTTKTGTKNLPVIANVVTELTQAGWPKDGKKK